MLHPSPSCLLLVGTQFGSVLVRLSWQIEVRNDSLPGKHEEAHPGPMLG